MNQNLTQGWDSPHPNVDVCNAKYFSTGASKGNEGNGKLLWQDTAKGIDL